jgi:hypothetical protein
VATGVTIFSDEDSYKKPFDAVVPACRAEYADIDKSKGGDVEARLAAVLEDMSTFKQFAAKLQDVAATNTFFQLPRLRRGLERLNGVHQLTVGPWRGVYLVSPSNAVVYAMLFTRNPHRIEKEHFDAILARYRAKIEAEPESS